MTTDDITPRVHAALDAIHDSALAGQERLAIRHALLSIVEGIGLIRRTLARCNATERDELLAAIRRRGDAIDEILREYGRQS